MNDEKRSSSSLIEEITELRQRLRIFQHMVEKSADGLVMSGLQGGITYFSPGAAALTGYSTEEALKMQAADLYPDGTETERQIMKRLRAEGQVSSRRREMLTKDGRVIEVHSTISLLYDDAGEESGTLAVFKDATEETRVEEALRKSEENNRQLSEEARWERERSKSLYQVSKGLAGIHETDAVLDLIVEEASRLLGATGAYSRLLNGDELVANASTDSVAEFLAEAAEIRRALALREESRADDTDLDTAPEKQSSMGSLGPERAGFYYSLGIAHHALGQHERAIESYDEAVRLNPGYAAAYNNRGNSYHDLGQHDRAIESYDEAVRLNPSYAAAYNNRGIARYDQGQHGRAIEDYDQAVLLNIEYAAAYNNRGNAHLALGQHERAIEDYDQAVRLDPSNSAAFNNRGTLYHALGQHERAIEDYDEVVRLNPRYSAAYSNRGRAYHDLGQHQRAVEDYDEAIRLDPRDTEFYINRGNTLSMLRKFDRSIEDYDEAIRLSPDRSDAYNNRGVTLHRLGRYAESERDFAKVAKLKALAGDGQQTGGSSGG